MSYDRGDMTKIRLATKNDAGAPYDPESLTLRIKRPNGEIEVREYPAESSIVREDVGTFYSILDLTEEGSWEYRWEPVGAQIGDVAAGNLFVGTDAFTDPFPDEDFTVSDIWARSPTLKARYPNGIGDGDLVLLVAAAAPLVGNLTGRIIAGTAGEAVPDSLQEIALRTIAMKTEQLANVLGSSKERRRSLSRGNLSSFSAGSYSESYFGPDQAMRAKRLDADPILSELLWALCTEEKKLEWLGYWDPENYPMGEGGLVAFEYGNRPNYSTWPWGC